MVGIPGEVAEDLGGQHAVRSISGLDALQAEEAGEQQACADQQHHRDGHLRHDQRALNPLAAAGVAGLAAALLQRRDEIDAAAERRQRAEQHAGQDRHAKREDQHHRIEPDFAGARREPANERRQHADGDPGEANADRSADGRQQRALGEQLPHQPAASRAERGAHRQLAIAAKHPRQREVGDVRARNQQHQSGDAEQDQQQLARAARQRFTHRNGGGAEARRFGSIHLLVVFSEGVANRADRAGGLFRAGAFLEAAKHISAPKARRFCAICCSPRARNGHASTGM